MSAANRKARREFKLAKRSLRSETKLTKFAMNTDYKIAAVKNGIDPNAFKASIVESAGKAVSSVAGSLSGASVGRAIANNQGNNDDSYFQKNIDGSGFGILSGNGSISTFGIMIAVIFGFLIFRK